MLPSGNAFHLSIIQFEKKNMRPYFNLLLLRTIFSAKIRIVNETNKPPESTHHDDGLISRQLTKESIKAMIHAV